MAQLRTARAADCGAICAVFASARAAGLPSLPVLHTSEEDLVFFGGLVASGSTTVAEEGERIAGFLVLGATRLEHLYVDPSCWRRGIGTLLLRAAQDARPGGFDLWVFQLNSRAIAFYERYGLHVAETTDGEHNEEREPDARMIWPGAGAR